MVFDSSTADFSRVFHHSTRNARVHRGRPHDDFPRQGIGHGAPLAETLEEVQPQAGQMPRHPLDCDVYLMYI